MAFPIPTSTRTNEVSRATTFFPRPPVCLSYFNGLNSLPFRNPHRAQSCVKKGNGGSEYDNFILGNNDTNNAARNVGSDNINNIWEEIEHLEAFAIGSRKDAVLDFCLSSPYLSPALRFWNILVEDSSKMQLQQRLSNRDIAARIVEAPSNLKSCSKAVILVASAAYGSDDMAALNILQRIKSANGFVIGLILKPFSFEGQRRQDEVKHFVDELQKLANFCIVVDTDALLEKDMVTLDEALKTSNNAVLMAINAISVLMLEKHKKLLEVPDKGIKELKAPEIRKILESYRFAKIGFGTGHDIKSSVSRAVYDCPFLGKNVKDFNDTIVCTFASSGTINDNDADSILETVRLTTESKTDIMLSIIHDPNLECNLIVTTIITFGSGQQSSQKNSIFSKLADHFPFVFNILKQQYPQQSDIKESFVREAPWFPEASFNQDDSEVLHKISLNLDDTSEVLGSYTEESLSDNVDEVLSSLRNDNNSYEESTDEFSESNSYPSACTPNAKGVATFEEELLTRYRLGPDNQYMDERAKEGDASTEVSLLLDSVNFYKLPVGVKHLERLNNRPEYTKYQSKWRTEDYRKPDFTPSVSWKGLSDWGFEASVDSNNISPSKSGSYVGNSNKQRVLSVRAASMLEAERDSDKKWSPVVEMKYRGGIYRGRFHGGLPEGKGRLSLENGGIYDGMWRYGKRSGMGTFYFSNGDVFQGSWRDDAMHGKGWLYFHTGDRWFVNFWKGKANGEGRFYSKLGDVFFGHFRNGWRHGHFLCISVDGTRLHEVWEEGVLVSREKLDPNADAT